MPLIIMAKASSAGGAGGFILLMTVSIICSSSRRLTGPSWALAMVLTAICSDALGMGGGAVAQPARRANSSLTSMVTLLVEYWPGPGLIRYFPGPYWAAVSFRLQSRMGIESRISTRWVPMIHRETFTLSVSKAVAGSSQAAKSSRPSVGSMGANLPESVDPLIGSGVGCGLRGVRICPAGMVAILRHVAGEVAR